LPVSGRELLATQMQRVWCHQQRLPGPWASAAAPQSSSSRGSMILTVRRGGLCPLQPLGGGSSQQRQRRPGGGSLAVVAQAGSSSSGDKQPTPSTSGSNAEEEQARPGLIANILKPLRDFGIGRTSMVQGGVGLFVFSGIGGWVGDGLVNVMRWEHMMVMVQALQPVLLNTGVISQPSHPFTAAPLPPASNLTLLHALLSPPLPLQGLRS
jgi:hypothetical protein